MGVHAAERPPRSRRAPRRSRPAAPQDTRRRRRGVCAALAWVIRVSTISADLQISKSLAGSCLCCVASLSLLSTSRVTRRAHELAAPDSLSPYAITAHLHASWQACQPCSRGPVCRSSAPLTLPAPSLACLCRTVTAPAGPLSMRSHLCGSCCRRHRRRRRRRSGCRLCRQDRSGHSRSATSPREIP